MPIDNPLADRDKCWSTGLVIFTGGKGENREECFNKH